ncbi:nuclear transport factor 2 family protein [Caulobacter vibrioides]|uniref:Nuclear transport factor 2 family protein n=1 Tax=Caulobacter vibrioides TaxID=155892 RepID=A0A290MUA8_CAUVI|nr:nuclear transport factor 2 family protein [Caulobacter vibrioides]ATC32538.1 nuclear transport factor 2 family protein [Caulobacter vibrioides]
MSEIDYVAFAQRFVAAIQAGDAEAVRAFYAPEAKIWHNIDHIEQTVDQNLKSLAWFVRTLPDRTYRVQRIAPLPDGFLQQHVLEATLPNGERWAMDACVVVRVEDGKITRLDEYLDSAKTAQLVAATR